MLLAELFQFLGLFFVPAFGMKFQLLDAGNDFISRFYFYLFSLYMVVAFIEFFT